MDLHLWVQFLFGTAKPDQPVPTQVVACILGLAAQVLEHFETELTFLDFEFVTFGEFLEV